MSWLSDPEPLPEMAEYFTSLIRLAWRQTWEKYASNPLPAVCLSVIAAAFGIYLQRHFGWLSREQMRDAFITLGCGLAAVVILYLFVFAIHVIYITPKRLYENAKSQRDSLRSQLDSAYDTRLHRRKEARENMFQRCMSMLKSPKPMFSFHVVVRHEAYNLEENDDVNWLCDEIGKTVYEHPFTNLDSCVPRSDRKEFLRWCHLFTNYDVTSGNKADHYIAAEQWTVEHKYIPSEKERVGSIFSNILGPPMVPASTQPSPTPDKGASPS